MISSFMFTTLNHLRSSFNKELDNGIKDNNIISITEGKKV